MPQYYFEFLFILNKLICLDFIDAGTKVALKAIYTFKLTQDFKILTKEILATNCEVQNNHLILCRC